MVSISFVYNMWTFCQLKSSIWSSIQCFTV